MAPRKLAADPLLNSRMKRHLKQLGVSSVDEYRTWCDSHGLTPALNKNLRQIEEEIRIQRSEAKNVTMQSSLETHIKALGFKRAEEYQAWCKAHNLNVSLNKSASQRKRELQVKQRSDFEQSDRDYARAKGDVVQTTRRIVDGRVHSDAVTHPGLRRVAELFENAENPLPDRNIFLRLIDAALRQADFLDVNPVIERFAQAPGNTLVDGLFALSLHPEHWIRPPETWKPTYKGLHRCFGEFARHLFAAYDIPLFMDSVWFSGVDETARSMQTWFIHIGNGGNIRSAGLPMDYTKKMSHYFMQSPDNYSVIEALRNGQILALGGDRELVGHINATRLGDNLEHEDFWVSVIHFFVNNVMLDFSYVGPVVEYIEHRKFAMQEIVGNDGVAVFADPPDPGFSMKGRTADALIELVDGWHEELNREKRKERGAKNWAASGISPFEMLEEDPVTGHTLRWTVEELLTRKELFDEGKAMKHCVKSYIPSCAKGQKSVWSLKREDTDTQARKRVLTIAVKNDMRRVVQARGKCNAMPGHRPPTQQAARVLRREEELLSEGRRVMKIWGNDNELTVPMHT